MARPERFELPDPRFVVWCPPITQPILRALVRPRFYFRIRLRREDPPLRCRTLVNASWPYRPPTWRLKRSRWRTGNDQPDKKVGHRPSRLTLGTSLEPFSRDYPFPRWPSERKRQVFSELRGGRTRTRTLDPLIKSQLLELRLGLFHRRARPNDPALPCAQPESRASDKRPPLQKSSPLDG